MTTIKATCPTCGEVSLTPDEIDLRVTGSTAGQASYAFACPGCALTVRKPADERIVRLLVSGGVTARQDDTVDPSQRRFEGPRFTHDDLLDFHALLETDDWFDALAEQVRRENVR